jgi:hypothetical protein
LNYHQNNQRSNVVTKQKKTPIEVSERIVKDKAGNAQKQTFTKTVLTPDEFRQRTVGNNPGTARKQKG